ncbi:MAG: multiheme c-type cytochrome [Planctomycetota bacterium]
MQSRSRSAAAIILLVMLPSVAFVGLDVDPTKATGCARPQDFISAKKCGECHKAIYKEWQSSAHSRAWVSEIYQRKLKEKKERHKRKAEPKVCYDCHIPQSVLKRLGKKPRRRKDEKTFHEGITCVSCHEKDGNIHGPFGSKTDAHPVEKDPVFTAGNVYGLCASCHDRDIGPVLAVGRDFKAAGLAAKGKSCIGCHMPEVERHIAVNALGKPVGEKRKGRRHRVRGPRDKEFLVKAFKLGARRNGTDVEVTVENQAGHKVPALTLRKFVFHVRQLDKGGKELAQGKFELHHENLLKVTEKRHFPFPLKAGVHQLEIRAEHVFEGQVVAEFLKTSLDL